MNSTEKRMQDLQGIVRMNSEILVRMRRVMAQIAECQNRSDVRGVKANKKGGPKH